MKVSILGTGMVGQAIAGKMTTLGHEVYMGSRNAGNTKSNTTPNPMTGVSFADWFSKNQSVNVVDYQGLPEDSDIIINATNGKGSVDALNAAGKEKLKGKIILDIANPLDFSQGTRIS
jgi:8-hydroxy-5-deazaflavin:NADPH oxidoreductase